MATICKEISTYLRAVEKKGKGAYCAEQIKLAAHIRKCFAEEDIYTDVEQLRKYLGLVKYFPYDRLFPWQEFLTALHACTYWKDTGLPRWPDLFTLVGRGAGKDGFIAYISMCLMSQLNGIHEYDVDICANNEEQAVRPVEDLVMALEEPGNENLKKSFYWTKERVKSTKTHSQLRGRTNNPKGKDGLRSGYVVFNEVHQYENYANINVFTTGLGKKKHPRRAYLTTQGHVRDGVIDDLIEKSERILNGEEPDDGFLPFICKLDSKDDVHDSKHWQKANPSLPYMPVLFAEIKKEYAEWKKHPALLPAFMTKRMNIPDGNPEMQVTEWDNIAATNRPLPDLDGWTCVVGVDYAMLNDFASVNLHFRDGDKRYDINHSWLCAASKDLPRVKAPWQQWAHDGFLTVVYEPQISPELIVAYIEGMGRIYNIEGIALDNFRYALLSPSLEAIGFAKKFDNVKLTRPSDIMIAAPVIDSCFLSQNFTWGDNPVLRWATNNTKLLRSSRSVGSDTGNFYYGKIEGRSRKTDPFMALVASMTIETDLGLGGEQTSDFEVWEM